MKRIFVAAGMGIPKNKKIKKEAEILARKIAKSGATYAQGGCADGVMGYTLKEFIKHSNKAVFYLPIKYYNNDAPKIEAIVGKDNFRPYIMKDEAHRLRTIKKSAICVILPGGSGTIEELFYVNETARADEHNMEMFLVNVDGFYDGILKQIESNIAEGLIKPKAIKFKVVSSVEEIDIDGILNKKK